MSAQAPGRDAVGPIRPKAPGREETGPKCTENGLQRRKWAYMGPFIQEWRPRPRRKTKCTQNGPIKPIERKSFRKTKQAGGSDGRAQKAIRATQKTVETSRNENGLSRRAHLFGRGGPARRSKFHASWAHWAETFLEHQGPGVRVGGPRKRSRRPKKPRKAGRDENNRLSWRAHLLRNRGPRRPRKSKIHAS